MNVFVCFSVFFYFDEIVLNKLLPSQDAGDFFRTFYAELVYTFVLCLIVLTNATTKDGSLHDFFGFTIGSCVPEA